MKPVPLAQILLLAVIPAGLFLSSIFLHAIAGSYYLSGIFDPEYVYLLNSLNLLNIQPPSHTDHPGTTLQIFGAIVIRSPRIEYALAFGNSLSGNRYGDALQRMYPNAMFYNIWSKEFHSFVTSIQDRVLVDQINEGRCIVLLGSSFTGPYAIYKSKLVLTPLLATSNWTLYRLVGLRS